MVEAAAKGCGSEEHRQIAWDLACKALTLLKNENDAFPLNVKAGEHTLILISAASRGAAGELAAKLLSEAGTLPEGAKIDSMVIEPETGEACVEAAKTADHVILVSRAWAADCLDPTTENGYPVGIMNQIIGDLHADGKPRLYVSEDCPNTIYAFENWKWLDGEKGATKDPIDNVRYLHTSDCIDLGGAPLPPAPHAVSSASRAASRFGARPLRFHR